MTSEINVNQDLPNIISGTFNTNEQSPDIDNPYWRGCVIYLNITSASGTGGLQPSVLFKDPGSGNYDSYGAIGAAKTSPSTYSYIVYPSTGMAVDSGGAQDTPLPRTFAIKIVTGDGSNYTYSVSLSMLK